MATIQAELRHIVIVDERTGAKVRGIVLPEEELLSMHRDLDRVRTILAIPHNELCWCVRGSFSIEADKMARCHQCGKVVLGASIAEIFDFLKEG